MGSTGIPYLPPPNPSQINQGAPQSVVARRPRVDTDLGITSSSDTTISCTIIIWDIKRISVQTHSRHIPALSYKIQIAFSKAIKELK